MKLKPSISLPFYDLNSEVLKLILNVKRTETIIKRLDAAGVQIKSFGDQRVVMHEDLIAAIESPQSMTVAKYQPKTELTKEIKDLLE